MLSNSEKMKIVRDVSRCITENFNGCKVVRHKNQKKECFTLHPMDIIFYPARHQKHNINY